MNIEDVKVGMWVVVEAGDRGVVTDPIDRHCILIEWDNGDIKYCSADEVRPLTLGDLKEGERFTFVNGPMFPGGRVFTGEQDAAGMLCSRAHVDAKGGSWARPDTPVSLVLDEPTTQPAADRLPAIGSRWTLPRCDELPRPVDYEVTGVGCEKYELHCVEILSGREFSIPAMMHLDLARPFVDPYTGSEWELLAECDGIHWQPATCAEYSIARLDLPNPNAPRPEPVCYSCAEVFDDDCGT